MGYFAGIGIALTLVITLATGGSLESNADRAQAARNAGASAAVVTSIMNGAQ